MPAPVFVRPPTPVILGSKAPLAARPVVARSEFVIALDVFHAFHDRFFVRGWAWHPRLAIKAVVVVFTSSLARVPFQGLLSDEAAARIGPHARSSGFDFEVPKPDDQQTAAIELWLETADGSVGRITDPATMIAERHALGPDLFKQFRERLAALETGTVLEIGSRDRSGVVRRDIVPARLRYVGVDVKNGPNVDVVGDAHRLSRLFPDLRFDAIFSIATFEHILMPWVVAVEMNKVMRPGAIAFVHSHQSFPLHEEPWDFWRYSDRAWSALFNQFSGFEILGANMGGALEMVPHYMDDVTYGMERNTRAYVSSVVLCRKIKDTQLTWSADADEILNEQYPQ